MDGFKKLELVVIFCLELIAFTDASGKCIFWSILIDILHLKKKQCYSTWTKGEVILEMVKFMSPVFRRL